MTFTCGCPEILVFSRETTGDVVLSEGIPEVVVFTHILLLDLWCYRDKLLDMWCYLRVLLKLWYLLTFFFWTCGVIGRNYCICGVI